MFRRVGRAGLRLLNSGNRGWQQPPQHHQQPPVGYGQQNNNMQPPVYNNQPPNNWQQQANFNDYNNNNGYGNNNNNNNNNNRRRGRRSGRRKGRSMKLHVLEATAKHSTGEYKCRVQIYHHKFAHKPLVTAFFDKPEPAPPAAEAGAQSADQNDKPRRPRCHFMHAFRLNLAPLLEDETVSIETEGKGGPEGLDTPVAKKFSFSKKAGGGGEISFSALSKGTPKEGDLPDVELTFPVGTNEMLILNTALKKALMANL